MSLSCQKGEIDRFFNRLDRPVEESRPDRQPDRRVDPTGAGLPDRFPSLLRIVLMSDGRILPTLFVENSEANRFNKFGNSMVSFLIQYLYARAVYV